MFHPDNSHSALPPALGNDFVVVPLKMIWKGRQLPVVAEDTVMVICLLSSAPCTFTCFDPFVSQVCDPHVGTK